MTTRRTESATPSITATEIADTAPRPLVVPEYAPFPLGWGSHIPVTQEEDACFAERAAREAGR